MATNNNNLHQPEGVSLFEHRRHGLYLNELKSKLSISGPDGLIAKSTEVHENLKSRTKFEKICQISFLGISANNIFDIGRNFLDDELPILGDDFENIIKNRREFADAGIWLRIRFLFIYPYSSHAMSIINAEMSHERAAMSGDHHEYPCMQRHLNVDQKRFDGSSFVRSQRITLGQIEKWMRKHDWENKSGVNTLTVRFTPVSPNLCGLMINNTGYCDSYLLAKEHAQKERLTYSSPLIKIDGDSKGEAAKLAFMRLNNHFQYLWESNITLDCQDATRYSPVKKEGLGDVVTPREIRYYHKSKRLVALDKLTLDDANKWRFKAANQFLRHSAEPENALDEEYIFISCGWFDGKPETAALKVRDWLENDFTNSGMASLKPILIEGKVGELLDDLVYDNLNKSSFGIVFLTSKNTVTAGSEEIRMARPNVYHELGYMMHKFDANRMPKNTDKQRIFVAVDHSTSVPSNISNIIYYQYDDRRNDSVYSLYYKIINWLKDNSILMENDSAYYKSVLEIHINRASGELVGTPDGSLVMQMTADLAKIK